MNPADDPATHQDNEMSKLKQALSEALIDAESHKTELYRLRKVNQQLNDDLDQRAICIRNVTSENEKVKSALNKITMERNFFVGEVNHLKQEHKMLQSKIENDAKEKIGGFFGEVRIKVKAKLQEAAAEREKLEINARNLISERDGLHVTIEEMMENKRELEQTLEEMRGVVNVLENHSSNLSVTNFKLKNKLSYYEEMEKETKPAGEGHEKKIKKLKEVVKYLHTFSSNLNDEKLDLQDEIEELKSKLETQGTEVQKREDPPPPRKLISRRTLFKDLSMASMQASSRSFKTEEHLTYPMAVEESSMSIKSEQSSFKPLKTEETPLRPFKAEQSLKSFKTFKSSKTLGTCDETDDGDGENDYSDRNAPFSPLLCGPSVAIGSREDPGRINSDRDFDQDEIVYPKREQSLRSLKTHKSSKTLKTCDETVDEDGEDDYSDRRATFSPLLCRSSVAAGSGKDPGKINPDCDFEIYERVDPTLERQGKMEPQQNLEMGEKSGRSRRAGGRMSFKDMSLGGISLKSFLSGGEDPCE